jgi:hypothetical protein
LETDTSKAEEVLEEFREIVPELPKIRVKVWTPYGLGGSSEQEVNTPEYDPVSKEIIIPHILLKEGREDELREGILHELGHYFLSPKITRPSPPFLFEYNEYATQRELEAILFSVLVKGKFTTSDKDMLLTVSDLSGIGGNTFREMVIAAAKKAERKTGRTFGNLLDEILKFLDDVEEGKETLSWLKPETKSLSPEKLSNFNVYNDLAKRVARSLEEAGFLVWNSWPYLDRNEILITIRGPLKDTDKDLLDDIFEEFGLSWKVGDTSVKKVLIIAS